MTGTPFPTERSCARRCVITAPTKNNASPLAAAIPIRGTPIPISNPTAPAASSTPKMGSHDFGIPNLLMLPRSHFGWMKSLIATDVRACDKHISIHLCSTTCAARRTCLQSKKGPGTCSDDPCRVCHEDGVVSEVSLNFLKTDYG
jgi:hypothetical protein